MTRLRLVALAGSALLLSSCGDGSPSALEPHSPEARRLASVWWQLFGMATAVYVVVAGFIIWSVVRHGDDDDRARRDHAFITFGGIAVPAVVLLVVGALTVDATNDVQPAADEPLRVEVIGHKWWWEVRYPDQGIVTANELHVPVGQPVAVTLRSDDVIHSFWVPQLGGKVDMIPGDTTSISFTVESPGAYTGECAEFCGLQHANMRFLVVADRPGDFERWVTVRLNPSVAPVTELEARGQAAFMSSACAGCHAISGTEATGEIGPDLTDFGARRTIGALLVPNTAENLADWIVDAPDLKPGVLMPPIALSDDERDAIVAYLESLR